MKQGVDHLVVHGAAVLRMGMQHERDGRVGALAVLVASFKSAFRPVEDHVRHRLFFLSFGNQPAQGGQENLPLWPKETGCRGPAATIGGASCRESVGPYV